jgi:hypothetical protein
MFATLGCHGPDAVPAPEPAPASEPVAADVTVQALPEPASAANRECGGAGRDPTGLPPLLARGAEKIGEGALRAGDQRTHGTVVLKYDPRMQVAPSSVGVRAPALVMTIDRAEVPDGGAWGAYHQLYPGKPLHLDIGPYRVDARTSADDTEVTYSVGKRACPERALIEKTTEPLALWLSTEAIRLHTYDMAGELLQLTIDGQGAAPRLDVMNLGYRQYFEPRPGERRTFRVGGHRITIDEVVPGPHTRFVDGAWQADGDARVHARVRIDPIAASEPPSPVPATTPCGAPGPVRTTLPPALAKFPPVRGDVTLAPGEQRRLGDRELELTATVVPPMRPHDDAHTIHELRLTGAADQLLGSLTMTPYDDRVWRVDRELLRIDREQAGSRRRVRRFVTACPHRVDVPAPREPFHVWLSSLGHDYVAVGPADRPVLQLQLHAEPRSVTLALSADQAHHARALVPDAAALAFTLGGYLVEVVDIVPGGDTRLEGSAWATGAAVPEVHVQLRVAPE